MFLEKAAQIGLIGEMEFVGDFLYRKIGRLEQIFDFENDVSVDDRFYRFVCRIAYDGSKIARRYAKFVGIECNVSLVGAMLFDERYEAT